MNKNNLKNIGLEALRRAYETHEELGSIGEQEVETNQFGDTAMRCDVEAEQVVLQTLKDYKIPIRVISEEHGTTNITNKPKHLGILDGLDGSVVYKRARNKGRYGTMFGIFSNANPKYSDYIFSGVMEHSAKQLFYSIKDEGSFVLENGNARKINCASTRNLDECIRIYVDEYWKTNRETFSEKLQDFGVECADSSAVHYVDLASERADLVLECTRKSNLEIAVAYGLVTEAGGVMLTLGGEKLGPKKYHEFGQDQRIHVVSAATGELGRELIDYLNNR